ncbi:hypothetical protein ASPVEDRAFT_877871 [Aspergillus versicolor CBS 583.65]|uniref:SMP-30/Gluconolactonase/LRE-like region domain-containing protein n=1 Tax=Aspergillus versicolor CBS 583.65 TaxID=1036611 RepID=A0A1L9Q1X7_ASPVE|nr:uncharacterized protein ASPVEDRAFT_877871 [Aspergillus versicolor CBS 583.65]OJJ07748.1 hypothetical protein ASPVEDRAFT_877871 [Aspergillus versicolor CBS 583.65]
MRTTTLFSLLSAAAAVYEPNYTAGKIYQLNNGTWIENLTQRTNLSCFTRLTRYDSPEVQEVNLLHPHSGPRTIYTFANATSATGITELSTERYAVLTLNHAVNTTTVSIWTLQTNALLPIATKVADSIVDSELLNGLAAVSPHIVLATNSFVGGIVRINLQNGIADEISAGDSFPAGVNGLKYQEPYLYYTNMFEGVFGRIAVDPSTGAPAGEAEVIASGDILVGADDFALAYWTNAAFVANYEKNTVVRINIDEKTAEVVVKEIPAPTPATFGASGGLFFATSGTGSDGGASLWRIMVPEEPPFDL